MLLKWGNFGAFSLWSLLWENYLSKNFLSELHSLCCEFVLHSVVLSWSQKKNWQIHHIESTTILINSHTPCINISFQEILWLSQSLTKWWLGNYDSWSISVSCLEVRKVFFIFPPCLQEYAVHNDFLPHIFQTVIKNHLVIPCYEIYVLNPLNAELNPICHLLALLGAHHILHVGRIRVKALVL
jgi:hypothetical protein